MTYRAGRSPAAVTRTRPVGQRRPVPAAGDRRPGLRRAGPAGRRAGPAPRPPPLRARGGGPARGGPARPGAAAPPGAGPAGAPAAPDPTRYGEPPAGPEGREGTHHSAPAADFETTGYTPTVARKGGRTDGRLP